MICLTRIKFERTSAETHLSKHKYSLAEYLTEFGHPVQCTEETINTTRTHKTHLSATTNQPTVPTKRLRATSPSNQSGNQTRHLSGNQQSYMSGQPVVGFNHIRLESTAAGDQAGSWMNLPPFHHPVGQVLGSSNGSGKEALALFSDKGGGMAIFSTIGTFFFKIPRLYIILQFFVGRKCMSKADMRKERKYR